VLLFGHKDAWGLSRLLKLKKSKLKANGTGFYGTNKTHPKRKGNTMFKIRRILLSGLVALLMVGMVAASDVSAPVYSDEVASPIGGGHFGSWVENICIDNEEHQCVRIWISLDINWLIGLFF
jgi:hypothetical protein